jgi:hypothetical protein
MARGHSILASHAMWASQEPVNDYQKGRPNDRLHSSSSTRDEIHKQRVDPQEKQTDPQSNKIVAKILAQSRGLLPCFPEAMCAAGAGQSLLKQIRIEKLPHPLVEQVTAYATQVFLDGKNCAYIQATSTVLDRGLAHKPAEQSRSRRFRLDVLKTRNARLCQLNVKGSKPFPGYNQATAFKNSQVFVCFASSHDWATLG